MPHLPGHNWIGPGTDVKKAGKPVDRDDEIAKKHDLAYEAAESDQHVRNADKEAIGEFWDDFKTNLNPHSLLGAAGIGAKYVTESVFGVQYPKKQFVATPFKSTMPGTKRAGHDLYDAASNKKFQGEAHETMYQRDNEGLPYSVDPSGSTGGVGGGGQHGGAAPSVGQDVVQICRSHHASLHNSTAIFKKCWIMRTWTFEAGLIIGGTSPNHSTMLVTGLHAVPVHHAAFYMSPQEYGDLPFGARAIGCSVKVIPKGFRTPFQVNTSSVATAANSQMLQFAGTRIGANLTYNTIAIVPLGTAADPTKISDYQTAKSDAWTHNLYNSSSPALFPACIVDSQRRLIGAYAFPTSLESGVVTDNTTSWPMLMNDTNVFDVRTQVGIPVVNYSYQFKCAPLNFKLPPFLNRFSMGVNQGAHQYQEHGGQMQQVTVDPTNGNLNRVNRLTTRNLGIADNYYSSRLEKGDLITFVQSEPRARNLKAQPSLEVGGIAALTSTPFDTTPIFARSDVYWQFDTEIAVEFDMNTTYSQTTNWPAVGTPEYISGNINQQLQNINTFDGRYCYRSADPEPPPMTERETPIEKIRNNNLPLPRQPRNVHVLNIKDK